jgi:hypothetical protein
MHKTKGQSGTAMLFGRCFTRGLPSAARLKTENETLPSPT